MTTAAQPPASLWRPEVWSVALVLAAWAASFSPVGGAQTAWLLLAAPLLEEAVLRCGLQQLLMRAGLQGWRGANLLTAVAFAAAHGWHRPTVWAALALLPALGIGAAYARTRRLGDAVAWHMAGNALWLMAAPLQLLWP